MNGAAECGTSNVHGPGHDARDWRDPRSYRLLSGNDRAALAWEWLRRDQGYIDWYACASELTRSGWDGGAVRAWGLHFCRGSQAFRPGRTAYLVGRYRPRHHRGRGTTGRAG
ncbi:transcriptional regulator domain-containing protein [Novosphingobium sp. YAF33]|uniref:transcriptional regulator domain-containing protein n=1 Tax=Novosphingobium sp. YAF33 TaxID=3233082 RepID=UPI003F99769E